MSKAKEPDEVDTAFLIVKRPDGSFYATTSMDAPLKIKHKATDSEIKHGCQDIAGVIRAMELSRIVVADMLAAAKPDDKATASSILQALSDRGIL
jgi:hypothetical protein